jgi:hypothetical protein
MSKPAAAKKSAPPKHNRNALMLPAETGKSPERSRADLALDPTAAGMATALAFSKGTFGETDITSLYLSLKDAMVAVRGGKMDGPEALLVSQATSLNLIYTELARRAALNMGEYIQASERYMRLALKAQAQCRSTIEALVALKNPPIVFARQANISAGHQQINNHSSAASASPARKFESAPNKLLEAEHGPGERLDGGAAGTPAGGDPQLEPMGAVDRTEEHCRQAPQQPQR